MPAVFLDRDGVINKAVWDKYTYRVDDVYVYSYSASAIKIINDLDIPVFIVTNQSGVHSKHMTLGEYHAITARILKQLESEGAEIVRVYECLHEKNGPCKCRKPGTLMIERAVQDYKLTGPMWMVGDMYTDIEMALQINIEPIMVCSGLFNEEQLNLTMNAVRKMHKSVTLCNDLLDACMTIKRRHEKD